METLMLGLAAVIGVALALGMALLNGCILGGVLWVGWNLGVAAVLLVPHAPYWACVAVALAVSAIAGQFKSKAASK